MKKIIIRFVISIIGFTALYQFILSTEKELKIGSPIFNDNIKNSKINKNFIEEYIPNSKEFILEGKKYKIKEAWIENAMTYQKKGNKKLAVKNFYISFENKLYYHIGFYVKENNNSKGKGWINDKIVFNINDFELKKEKIELLFWVKNDTIPVIFVKKMPI